MNSNPTDDIELSLKNKGYDTIIGVDEVGRGSGALPVVAAAVILPDGFDTTGIKDSKKLSAAKREKLSIYIRNNCQYSIAEVSEKIIDEINILEATKLVMKRAIDGLNIDGRAVAIIDGNFIPNGLYIEAKSFVGGDSLSYSIAAASIIAKVYRDALVMEKHKEYPIYGWDKNKTYLTKEHRNAIRLYGPCQYHRLSFTLI